MNNQLPIEDTLSAEAIRAGLKTICFGQKVAYLQSTESTNLIAKELIQEGAQEGTLVITDYQTRGRGRLERSWWSPPGENLLFSLIFRPEVIHPFHLTLISSLAVAEAIRKETGLAALIKWPNDIYLRGKKVSGILSELGTKDEHGQYVIVGIGINVNGDPSKHPEIHKFATAISVELGHNFSRLRLLKVILELIEHYYYLLKKADLDSLRDTWDSLSLIKGRRVRVVSGEYLKEGIAESIDDDGFLILKEDSGKRSCIISADVSLSLI